MKNKRLRRLATVALLSASFLIPTVTIAEYYLCRGMGTPFTEHYRPIEGLDCMCDSQNQGPIITCIPDQSYPESCLTRWCSSTNCCKTNNP